MQETINGRIPLYTVDPVQVRQWCGWRAGKITGNLEIGTHCDTLAKGKYVLVGTYMYFGSVGKPTLLYSGCLRDVREFAELHLCGEPEHLAFGGCGVWQVEVWHLIPALVCDVCGKQLNDGKYVTCEYMGSEVLCFDCADKEYDRSIVRMLAFRPASKIDRMRFAYCDWLSLDAGLQSDSSMIGLYAFKSHTLNAFVSVMQYGGKYYLPTDWQSKQPQNLEDVNLTAWRPADYFVDHTELWN